MTKQKIKWLNDPNDLRYRFGEGLLKSLPVVLSFVLISGLAQLHSNSVFDNNEIHNLLEGAPAMALAYALMRLRKLV